MKFLLKLRWMAYLLILCIGFGGTASVFAQDLPRYEENTLYVKFKDGSGISAKKMLDAKNDTKIIRTSMLGLSNNLMNRFKIDPEALSLSLFDNPVLDKTFMISVDPQAKAGIEQLMDELEKNPDVEYVERVPFNRIFSANPPVNDPYYGNITANEKTFNVSWHLDLINAPKAWQIQTGKPEIIVAVVDNAIWGAHEDLQIPSSRQYNCVKKELGNSAPPVEYGIQQNEQCEMSDLYTSQCIPYDFSHGTHCAGAIGAINDNNTGIASIAGGVSLMGVAGPSRQYPSGIMNSYHGIEWAASHGAKIISCSWGSDDFTYTNEAVVRACYDKGIIVIAASGNDNIATPHYPAAYTPYVISVGSVDADKKKSSFSNHGYWVDILSPGGEDTTAYKTQIFSTTYCQNQYTRLLADVDIFNGKYYDEMSGTSMATPVLAGVVALMLSKDATLTTDQVRTILQNTGQNLEGNSSRSYYNEYCRIVDAYAALDFITDAQFAPTVDSLSAETAYDSVWLTWKAPETTETVTGYNVYRNGEKIAENYQAYEFLDTQRPSTTFRYAVEPIYENANLYTLRAEINVAVKEYFTISAIVRPDDSYGYVEGSGKFEKRQIYTLKAIPYDNYQFDYWTDERGTKLFGATLTGPTMQNRRYFAYFSEKKGNENLQSLKKAVRISPNPAKDEINIQCTDYELQHIRISDMQGRIVYNAGCIDCRTHSLNIGIGSWGKGTYIVQVTTSNGTVSQKLIKR
ncbi:MAG: S8 family serine peptidase [Bacteroidales bacterium]|nr:S8 family serine peptidase [Bacteroidales bacterium]